MYIYTHICIHTHCLGLVAVAARGRRASRALLPRATTIFGNLCNCNTYLLLCNAIFINSMDGSPQKKV